MSLPTIPSFFHLLHRTALESKAAALFCDTSGLGDVLHVPCTGSETAQAASPWSPGHTAGPCPSNPAVGFSNPSAVLHCLLPGTVCVLGFWDTCVFWWHPLPKELLLQVVFSVGFFPPVNANFIAYYLSYVVLFSDKLPLLVCCCVPGSRLSHLTQSAEVY